MSKEISKAQEQSYSNLWEKDVIQRIAKKISKHGIDTELVFGLFSRGAAECTHEDFKYTILTRLNLKNELSDRELDMFIKNNIRFGQKKIIEYADFQAVFADQINAQKKAAGTHEEYDHAQMLRYNSMMNQDAFEASMSGTLSQTLGNKTLRRTGTVEGLSFMDFMSKDAENVLCKCVIHSSYDLVLD